MRSRVAVFLGLSAVVVVMPVGCSEPEWGPSPSGPSNWSGSGTGGAAGGGGSGGSGAGVPIDAYKECSEYCVKLTTELCPSSLTPESCIAQYCVQFRNDVGANCQDEFDAYFACVNAWVHSLPAGTMECHWSSVECAPLHQKLNACQWDYGCIPQSSCHDNQPAPNGGMGCSCKAYCQQRFLSTLCWPDGTKQVCACAVEDIVVGTCEEAPEPCGYPDLYAGCCDQYFMIP